MVHQLVQAQSRILQIQDTVREQQAVCYYQREVSVLEILPMNQKYRSHASQTSSNRGYA